MPTSPALSPVSFTNITLADRFWAPRVRVNREKTIPIEYKQCKDTGRIDALRLQWKAGQEPVPHVFWDSDIAKWIEAASYSLANHPDRQLDKTMDDVIDLLAKSQQPDGYLNSHFVPVEPEKRWTNLRDAHEMYCAGHLMEAAVAHFQATGKRTLLDVLCRYADHIDRMFGPEPGKKRGYCGHPEVELALVKLYRATGEKRYLNLARYFVDERGQQPHYFDQEARARGDDPAKYWAKNHEYTQSHKPLREQDRIVGHAVRGMYIYSAMADLARELNDASLQKACERLWRQLTEKMLYVTAGIGSSGHNEGYTFEYDLPNETAYAETCAAIGLVFWAHRLLQIDCDSRYADVMERALYNGTISGVSLDGKKFFYENPLASLGNHHRQEWFGCACCPPNVARMIASVGEYVYSTNECTIAVHLYTQSSAHMRVGAQNVTMTQTTDYPWDGKVTLAVEPSSGPVEFTVKLRVPDWCRKATVTVNGKPAGKTREKGYAVIRRTWKAGDAIVLNLPMPVERVYARPKVRMDCGRVALQRGPIVYALESVDNGPDLNKIALPRKAKLTTRFEKGLLGGVVTISGRAVKCQDKGKDGPLYGVTPPRGEPKVFKAIPYCCWDNRAPGEMLVWLREG